MSDLSHALCGARLRRGGACQLPPAAGKRRCFQHGGASGIGAKKGSRNAWKHGFYGAAATAERRQINAFIRQCQHTLRDVEAAWKAERQDR